MTQSAQSTTRDCVFCAIIAGRAQASVVHEDETSMAFMDMNPVTPGHLLVVPRTHAVGLEDLDPETSAHVWSLGHRLSRALRRSGLRCEGINLLLCDGPETTERSRTLLNGDARAITDALTPEDPQTVLRHAVPISTRRPPRSS